MDETVKSILGEIIQLSEAASISTIEEDGDYKEISVSELQELFRDKSYQLAGLLGMEDLYLKGK